MKLRDYFLTGRFNPEGLPPEFAARIRLGDPTLLVVTTLDASTTAYSWRANRAQTHGCWWLCQLLEPFEDLPDPFSPAYDTHRYWVQALCPILPSQLNVDAHNNYFYPEGRVLLPWINATRTRGVLDWSQPLP